jgi:hypothetical protein
MAPFTPISLTGETSAAVNGGYAVNLELTAEPSARWISEFESYDWASIVGGVAAPPKIVGSAVAVPDLPNDGYYRDVFTRISQALNRTNDTLAHISEGETTAPEDLFSEWFEQKNKD